MFELMIEQNFAAAHQLRGYKGECERLHGHNWKVNVFVMADRLGEIDIAIDFHDLKRMTRETLAQLDHAYLNDVFPFTEINPSSENIAKWIYDTMKKKIEQIPDEENGGHVRLSAITVWESETASATYYED
jgi:6-pyruvoyltetrahydropterin/6-carboxytetrahydropterin synthase